MDSPFPALQRNILIGSKQAYPNAEIDVVDLMGGVRDELIGSRGTIGAYQSRIEVAVNVLSVTAENSRAAESRIRDADVASEAAELTRVNLLQQLTSSILAQANQQHAEISESFPATAKSDPPLAVSPVAGSLLFVKKASSPIGEDVF